jgi:AraC-like DNA-binding protein
MLLNGMVLQPGEIAFHVGGERFHQRTTGATAWGLVAIAPRFASIYAAALSGRHFRLPSAGRVFCPPAADAARFVRLHERICHLAETRPASIGSPEVARALEQKLIHELMTCFCGSQTRTEPVRIGRHAAILARLEQQLAVCANRLLTMRELCAIIGVSQRTLEVCCREFLGMTAKRYFRLRRLNDVRAALLSADPDTAKVSEIARSHNFTELGRFAASYQEMFGEVPSITLRRVRHATAVGDVPFLRNLKPSAP